MGILLGSLAFDVLDRLTGQWNVLDLEWFEQAYTTAFGIPGLWFGVSLVMWWIMLLVMCLWVRRYYRRGFYGLISFRSEVNRKFSHVRLADFMAAKKLHAEDWDVRPINDRIIVSWEEVDKTLWGGTYPRIQLEYSAHLGIIHAVTCTYHKNRAKEDQAFNPAVSMQAITHAVTLVWLTPPRVTWTAGTPRARHGRVG